jgi:hypothetical protein
MAIEAVGMAQASRPAAASQSWRADLSRHINGPHINQRQALASLAQLPAKSGAEAARGLKSALQNRRGAERSAAIKRLGRSADLAAPGGFVVSGFLQGTEWKSKTQQVREKNVREKKLVALHGLQARMRILTGRIEALEDELDLLGWKPRVYHCPNYKPPYPDRVVEELCALPEKGRAQRVQEMAAEEGITRKSVYRKLQKSLRWTLRRREDPALETKSDAVLSKRAAVSDLG